eukprot:tig00001231_g7655.t1
MDSGGLDLACIEASCGAYRTRLEALAGRVEGVDAAARVSEAAIARLEAEPARVSGVVVKQGRAVAAVRERLGGREPRRPPPTLTTVRVGPRRPQRRWTWTGRCQVEARNRGLEGQLREAEGRVRDVELQAAGLITKLDGARREKEELEGRLRAAEKEARAAKGPWGGGAVARRPHPRPHRLERDLAVAPMTEKIRKPVRPVAAQGSSITVRYLCLLAMNQCVWALLKT